MADEQPNGNVTRYRLDKLEHRLKGDEEATKLVAQMGAKTNEQVKVHDERFREVDRRLEDIETKADEVPVLRTELAQVIDTLRAARNAFFAAAGGLALLAAAIIFNPAS